jgi:hypothetical protein
MKKLSRRDMTNGRKPLDFRHDFIVSRNATYSLSFLLFTGALTHFWPASNDHFMPAYNLTLLLGAKSSPDRLELGPRRQKNDSHACMKREMTNVLMVRCSRLSVVDDGIS